ncbi:MAG: hypothetical protein JOY59_03745 [Candidatus Eremiobacteraeota bacterium]|nr:hypothetical protein [Candidatus Eremiobacteraeota bacterium]
MQLTRLIGREADTAKIAELLQKTRLLTLHGTGGIGKTRCAVHVGGSVLPSWPDGVWFVALAGLSDASLVPNEIASVLSIRESPKRPLLETLAMHLKDRTLLLIFDNCEHVSHGAAESAEAILRGCPRVRILATSRSVLGIAGEHAYRIPSLAVPANDSAASLSALSALEYSAVALFVERATALDCRFEWSDRTAPIVVDICRRLDGIPLALELAAARVNILSPRALSRQLDARFALLTAGERTAPSRHQTMRALIDWSYSLLSPAEQRLFRRLAIFAGGWTLEAATTVCSADGIQEPDAVGILLSLVSKSLVVADIDIESSRYRMLESMRAYAHEKLEESGEQETLARRHAEWMADFADRRYEVLWKTALPAWFSDVEPEMENARAAMAWSLRSAHTAPLAGRIAGSLTPVFQERRLEGIRWLKAAIEALAGSAPSVTQANIWRGLANFESGVQRIEAAERAIAQSDGIEDPAGLSVGYYLLSTGLLHAGRLEEAERACDLSESLLRSLHRENSRLYAAMLKVKAYLVKEHGRLEECRALLVRSRNLFAALGEECDAALNVGTLGALDFEAGDAAAALVLAKQAAEMLEVAEETGHARDSRIRAIALANVARYSLAVGDSDGARAAARSSLELSLRCGEALELVTAMEILAAIAALWRDPRRAAKMLGYADAWHRNAGYERQAGEKKTYDDAISSLREQLPLEEVEALIAQGARLTEKQALELALHDGSQARLQEPHSVAVGV